MIKVYRVGPESPDQSFWYNGGKEDNSLLVNTKELITWPMPYSPEWYAYHGFNWRACCTSLQGIRDYFQGAALAEIRDVLGGYLHVFELPDNGIIFREDERYHLFRTDIATHVESSKYSTGLF